MNKSIKQLLLVSCLLAVVAVIFLYGKSRKTETNNSTKDTTSVMLIGGWEAKTGGFANEINFAVEDGKNILRYYSNGGGEDIMRMQEECTWDYTDSVLKIACPNSGINDSFDKISVSSTSLNLSSSTSNDDSGTYERILKAVSSQNIEEQKLAFCKKQGFYIPNSTTDFEPKVTQLSVQGEVLVDCYADNAGTSLSLYVAKINNDTVERLWFFPTEPDASIRSIDKIDVRDLDTDSIDEVTFETYGFGGSCSWYNNSINVYSLKMNILFSKSVSSTVDASCTKYEKPTTTYSDTIHQANSQIRKFIDYVVLEQKWQS